MKQRVTRSEIKSYFNTVINCDYCAAQDIARLCGVSEEYYNAGGYGWNWDAYDIENVALVYGYRNFPAAPWIQSHNGRKIINYLKTLKTLRGRRAAAIRLINKYASK